MSEEITPEELLKDLEHLQNFKDIRLLILFLHLYLEHFINELANEKRIKKPSIVSKAEALKERGIIEEDIVKVISLIYDLRNHLVHHLRPDIKLLERWIMDFKSSIEVSEELLTKAMVKTTGWNRIQLYGIPVIFKLFLKLKEIKKEEINYKMEIALEENYLFHFKLFKKEI